MHSEEFDYVIVGAGSAGCVLADKLSASGRQKVLLIEAGGSDAKFWVKVPVGYGFTFSDPRLNWSYNTQPDPGLKSRSIYWPRGRVIGGSSTINAMAYVRGLTHDFDDWGSAGATGWNWHTVHQTYERLEQNIEFNGSKKPQKRGDGPMNVLDLSDQMHPFSEHFLEAAADLGWPILDNMNEPNTEGLSYFRSTVRNGFRCSSADAFLRPALKRPNLRVVSHALVERLNIRNGQAWGVRYRTGGQLTSVRAAREVIVSAGAINSPQLLQLSGVGPAELLKSHGITVEHDLEQVGKGLQDHLAISHYFDAREPTLNNKLGNRFGQLLAGIQYVITRRGALSVPVNQVGGFVRSIDNCSVPDMQVFCNPASYTIAATGKPKIDCAPGYLLSAQPCRPTSRGEVLIASSDPKEAPLIHPNSLSTDADIGAAVRACKLVRALALTPTIQNVTKLRRSPDVAVMNEQEMLENFRQRASTVFHPTCTCRMGSDATDSVLDARLRVHGVRGLRVVDASAFPNITSGNTNAPTIMLAMRAADLIIEDAVVRTD